MIRRLGVLSFLVAVCLRAVPSEAALRTFVATTGSDANACSRPAPCRTFGAAMAQTDSRGEILVLDSGGYGPFIIDKAVSVIAIDATYAGITPSSGVAITIQFNFLSPSGDGDIVHLRGLVLRGMGAADGILHTGGPSTLIVEDCSISYFTDAGIQSTQGSRANLIVRNTKSRRNRYGFLFSNNSGGRADFDHCVADLNDDNGFLLQGNAFSAVISNSSASGNRGLAPAGIGGGIEVFSGSNEESARATLINNIVADNVDAGLVAEGLASGQLNVNPQVVVENCTFSGNSLGISAGLGARAWVSNSTITHNSTFGVIGSVLSRSNNTLERNSDGNVFIGTYTPK